MLNEEMLRNMHTSQCETHCKRKKSSDTQTSHGLNLFVIASKVVVSDWRSIQIWAVTARPSVLIAIYVT